MATMRKCSVWMAAMALVALVALPAMAADEPKAAAPDAAKKAAPDKKADAAKSPDGWYQWRGPGHDAQWPGVPAKLPEGKLLWQAKLSGECYAGLVAAEGYLVVCDAVEESQDIFRCFKADTGEKVWTREFENEREMDYGPHPRATPVIFGGRVFALDAFGLLRAFDLKTGKLDWERNLAEDFAAGEPPEWGYCSSPLIEGGKLVVMAGGRKGAVAALDPATGKTAWAGPAGGLEYSSPIAATLGGVRQIVGMTAGACNGWDASNGNRLWSIPVDSSGGYVVPTPVVVGDKLLLTDNENATRLYAFESGGKIVEEPVATNDDLYSESSTPTVCGDMVLGETEGLIALSPKDLETLWIEDSDRGLTSGVLHIIASKDRALVFCDNGELVLLQPTKAACKIVGKFKATKSSWVFPAVYDGRIFVRDRANLFCFDLTGDHKPVAAAPKADEEKEQAGDDEESEDMEEE